MGIVSGSKNQRYARPILDENGNQIAVYCLNLEVTVTFPAKPPIGIMPENLWKEQRLSDLKEAIFRYAKNDKPYPKEWGEEYDKLIEELKKD